MRPSLVLQHPGRWARAKAGQANDEDGPAGPARGLRQAGRLARVLLGQHVALVGENVISVMQGQPSRVAASNVGHQ